MLEHFRRGEKAKNSTLHVDEKRIFVPFRNTQELQPVDLDKAYRRGETALIIKQKIEFKGIMGAVSIWANPQPQFEEDFLTPLGDVHLTTTYSGGSVYFTEAPCFIGIEFEAKTQEQFDILENYQTQVYLNDEVYYLDCTGAVDSEFVFHEFKRKKYVFVQDWILKDNDGVKINVLLPQNAIALSAIRMRIIDYDDDNNDDEEEELDPNPSTMPKILITS